MTVVKSPYTKIFEVSALFLNCEQKRVNKFKVLSPKGFERKLDAGILSLEVMDLPDEKKSYVLVYKTTTLSILYTGILNAQSRHRRVPEKASKHQLKTAQVFTNKEGKKALTYCAINFVRFEDMEQFEGFYKEAIDTIGKQK